MPDTKISAGADPVTLMATDKVPLARSASTTAYAATMAEMAAYTSTGLAPLASPPLTGTPTAPTVTPATDSSTKLATTAFVQSAMAVNVAVNNTNYIDNSGFTVNQRGYTSGTALAAAAFGFDRWKAGASGCTLTFTAAPASTVVTITAGSLQQVIEGAGLVTGTYTLSWTGTAQARIGGGSYAASPINTVSATAGTNLTIEFNTGTVSRVKLEMGTTATTWQPEPPQRELARCQRFYQVITNYLAAGYVPLATWVYGTYGLPVTMRAAPTVTFSGVVYSNASGLAAPGVNPGSVVFSINAAAAGSANANGTAILSADL